MDGDGGGPEHPVAGAMMVEGANNAEGSDGDSEMERQPEGAILEWGDMAVARAAAFGEDDEARAAVNGLPRAAPHALEFGRAADIRNGNVSEMLHQPAVRGDFEVRFQLPTAHELRDGAVEDEWVEQVDVVGNEKARALRVKAGGAPDTNFSAGEEHNPAAKGALEIIVLAMVEEEGQGNQNRDHDEEMEDADRPEPCAAEREPELLHTKTSSAAGRISRVRRCSVYTSPSTMASTGASKSKTMRRDGWREASACFKCVPSYSEGRL